MTTDFRALSCQEKKKLADNRSTPVETLRVLATDEDWRVRWMVAGNSNTPVETLNRLATDDDSDVRWMVAGNSNGFPLTP